MNQDFSGSTIRTGSGGSARAGDVGSGNSGRLDQKFNNSKLTTGDGGSHYKYARGVTSGRGGDIGSDNQNSTSDTLRQNFTGADTTTGSGAKSTSTNYPDDAVGSFGRGGDVGSGGRFK